MWTFCSCVHVSLNNQFAVRKFRNPKKQFSFVTGRKQNRTVHWACQQGTKLRCQSCKNRRRPSSGWHRAGQVMGVGAGNKTSSGKNQGIAPLGTFQMQVMEPFCLEIASPTCPQHGNVPELCTRLSRGTAFQCKPPGGVPEKSST